MKSLLTIAIPPDFEIVVKKAQNVKIGEILAKKKIVDKKEKIPLSKILTVKPQKISAYLTKKIGSSVKKGEILAKKSGIFKNTQILSPVSGILEYIDVKKGDLFLTTEISEEVFELCPIEGIVEKVTDEGIVISFEGKIIEGEKGKGERAIGSLLVFNKLVDIFDFGNEVSDKIVIGKGFTEGARAKMATLGVKGLLACQYYEDFSLIVKFNEKQFNQLSSLVGKNIVVLGEKKCVIVPVAS